MSLEIMRVFHNNRRVNQHWDIVIGHKLQSCEKDGGNPPVPEGNRPLDSSIWKFSCPIFNGTNREKAKETDLMLSPTASNNNSTTHSPRVHRKCTPG